MLDPAASIGDGYRVQAQIITWSGADVLLVPNSALFRNGSEWVAFTIEACRARRRLVSVGHRGARASEVLDGLGVGEHVIVFPSDRIVAGRKVRATVQRAAR